jgi:hypothetical protein
MHVSSRPMPRSMRHPSMSPRQVHLLPRLRRVSSRPMHVSSRPMPRSMRHPSMSPREVHRLPRLRHVSSRPMHVSSRPMPRSMRYASMSRRQVHRLPRLRHVSSVAAHVRRESPGRSPNPVHPYGEFPPSTYSTFGVSPPARRRASRPRRLGPRSLTTTGGAAPRFDHPKNIWRLCRPAMSDRRCIRGIRRCIHRRCSSGPRRRKGYRDAGAWRDNRLGRSSNTRTGGRSLSAIGRNCKRLRRTSTRGR